MHMSNDWFMWSQDLILLTHIICYHPVLWLPSLDSLFYNVSRRYFPYGRLLSLDLLLGGLAGGILSISASGCIMIKTTVWQISPFFSDQVATILSCAGSLFRPLRFMPAHAIPLKYSESTFTGESVIALSYLFQHLQTLHGF